jgi:hypothetical protein
MALMTATVECARAAIRGWTSSRKDIRSALNAAALYPFFAMYLFTLC